MTAALTVLLAVDHARAADQDVNVGHALIVTRDFQIYVKAERRAVVFTGYLPAKWAYSVSVDANHDGKWGYGPYDKDSKAKPTGDIAFGSTEGQVCPQYVYASYQYDPDIIYATSECGARTSAATYAAINLSGDRMMDVYSIPQTEMSPTNGRAEFVLSVWDGKSSAYFGSALVPLEITLPAGT